MLINVSDDGYLLMKDKPFHDLLLKFLLLPSNSSPLLKRIILKNILFFKILRVMKLIHHFLRWCLHLEILEWWCLINKLMSLRGSSAATTYSPLPAINANLYWFKWSYSQQLDKSIRSALKWCVGRCLHTNSSLSLVSEEMLMTQAWGFDCKPLPVSSDTFSPSLSLSSLYQCTNHGVR